jgi:dihydrofolate reductase
MTKLRLNITMSLDGYVAGPNQSVTHPLGEGGEQLHEWAFATRTFRAVHGMEGGATGPDDDIAAEYFHNVGATIMGRHMFGGGNGPWGDKPWNGWWGDDPPFHMPVFVLTHHARKPLEMEGGTTFHFVTDARRTPRAAKTSPWAAALMSRSNTSKRGLLMRWTFISFQCCWVTALVSSTTAMDGRVTSSAFALSAHHRSAITSIV